MKPHSGATAGSITLACGHLSSILHTVAAEASCGESSADKAEFDAFTALFNDCPRKYRVLAIEKHVCNIICSINARIVDRVLLDEMNHRAADERSEKDGRFIDARFVSEFAEVFEVQHLELSADDRRVLCTYLRRICRKEKYYRTANAALLFGFIRDSVPMSEPGAPRPSDRLCEADIAQILNGLTETGKWAVADRVIVAIQDIDMKRRCQAIVEAWAVSHKRFTVAERMTVSLLTAPAPKHLYDPSDELPAATTPAQTMAAATSHSGTGNGEALESGETTDNTRNRLTVDRRYQLRYLRAVLLRVGGAVAHDGKKMRGPVSTAPGRRPLTTWEAVRQLVVACMYAGEERGMRRFLCNLLLDFGLVGPMGLGMVRRRLKLTQVYTDDVLRQAHLRACGAGGTGSDESAVALSMLSACWRPVMRLCDREETLTALRGGVDVPALVSTTARTPVEVYTVMDRETLQAFGGFVDGLLQGLDGGALEGGVLPLAVDAEWRPQRSGLPLPVPRSGSDTAGVDAGGVNGGVASAINWPVSVLQFALGTRVVVLLDLLSLHQAQASCVSNAPTAAPTRPSNSTVAQDASFTPLMEASMGRLAQHSSVCFLGFGLANDLVRVASTYPLWSHVFRGVSRLVELRELVHRAGFIATTQVSLSAVVEQVLGKPLDKAQQQSDWQRRPLSTKQLLYAAIDAHVGVAVVKELGSSVYKPDTSDDGSATPCTPLDGGQPPEEEGIGGDEVDAKDTEGGGESGSIAWNWCRSLAESPHAPLRLDEAVLEQAIVGFKEDGIPTNIKYTPVYTPACTTTVTGSTGQIPAKAVSQSSGDDDRLWREARIWSGERTDAGSARVAAALEQRTIPTSRLLMLPRAETVDLTAAGLSTPTWRFVKSLAFMAGGAPVIVVCPVGAKVSRSRLAAALSISKRKLRLAKEEECSALFGYVPGTFPPIGHGPDVRVLIDSSVRQVAANALDQEGNDSASKLPRLPGPPPPGTLLAGGGSPNTMLMLTGPELFAAAEQEYDLVEPVADAALGGSNPITIESEASNVAIAGSASSTAVDGTAVGPMLSVAEATSARQRPPVWRQEGIPELPARALTDPTFELSASQARHLEAVCTAPAHFVVDSMMGRLVRWLRVVGYDTEYDPTQQEEALMRWAGDDLRILLTRDRKLVGKRAEAVCVWFVEPNDTKAQFQEVVDHFQLTCAPEDLMSRCARCNGEGYNRLTAEQAAPLGVVPVKVLRMVDEYWQCKRCRKMYWEGPKFYDTRDKFGSMINPSRDEGEDDDDEKGEGVSTRGSDEEKESDYGEAVAA